MGASQDTHCMIAVQHSPSLRDLCPELFSIYRSSRGLGLLASSYLATGFLP